MINDQNFCKSHKKRKNTSIKISISWLQWQDYYPLSYIATHNWCWQMFWEIQRNLPVFQIRHMATISFWQAGKSRPWIVTILDFQGPELDKKKVKKMLMLWSSPTTKSGQAPYGFLPVVRSGQQSKYLVAVQCVANIVKLSPVHNVHFVKYDGPVVKSWNPKIHFLMGKKYFWGYFSYVVLGRKL